MTGFQKREIENHSELVEIVNNTLKNGNKLKYLQKRLTGALENYKYKKHVSMVSSMSNFRTVFDCKRSVIKPENNTEMLSMYETKPFENKDTCILHRTLMNNYKTAIYNKYMDNKIVKTSTNIIIESIYYLIRSFVNHYQNNTPLEEKMNLISIIIEYVKKYNKYKENRKINIKEQELLRIIANTEINKGMTINKLIKYRKNIDFFNYLREKFDKYLEKLD
jgi:hypothetical protein